MSDDHGPRWGSWGVGSILVLISVVMFAVGAFGGSIGGLNLHMLGLAFFAAGHLV